MNIAESCHRGGTKRARGGRKSRTRKHVLGAVGVCTTPYQQFILLSRKGSKPNKKSSRSAQAFCTCTHKTKTHTHMFVLCVLKELA